MKLLFDQNISYKVLKKLELSFPGSKHISEIGLTNNSDIEIWKFSQVNNYTIVTFDSDFIDISILKGFPPKIILMKTGNLNTFEFISIFMKHENSIKEFLSTQNEIAYLEIYYSK